MPPPCAVRCPTWMFEPLPLPKILHGMLWTRLAPVQVRLLETGAMQPCEDVPIGSFPWSEAPEEQQVQHCIAHLANLFCGEVHGWVMQVLPLPSL